MADAPAHERVYVRHVRTGDIGYIVWRDGKQLVRLDRRAEEILRPWDENIWISDRTVGRMTEAQMAMVAFGADKVLCRFLGMTKTSLREWNKMSDDERRRWIIAGPATHQTRIALYKCIMQCLDTMKEVRDGASDGEANHQRPGP